MSFSYLKELFRLRFGKHKLKRHKKRRGVIKQSYQNKKTQGKKNKWKSRVFPEPLDLLVSQNLSCATIYQNLPAIT